VLAGCGTSSPVRAVSVKSHTTTPRLADCSATNPPPCIQVATTTTTTSTTTPTTTTTTTVPCPSGLVTSTIGLTSESGLTGVTGEIHNGRNDPIQDIVIAFSVQNTNGALQPTFDYGLNGILPPNTTQSWTDYAEGGTANATSATVTDVTYLDVGC
jgi:hypothetical protein